jgi:hypothetical protein
MTITTVIEVDLAGISQDSWGTFGRHIMMAKALGVTAMWKFSCEDYPRRDLSRITSAWIMMVRSIAAYADNMLEPQRGQDIHGLRIFSCSRGLIIMFGYLQRVYTPDISSTFVLPSSNTAETSQIMVLKLFCFLALCLFHL